MIKIIEKSLCNTCEHERLCVLTKNKNSIYNCSDYQQGTNEDFDLKKEDKTELVLN
ncbi:hypothetical protein JM80_0937 [Cellulophaga sp. RHA_52]|uniref:hypothetical protein n=1 Tax=Cellulophaga lytica TaxID=979 RepID=UPI00119919B8|nr:hypothetical protein JM80_0937 [Cellulophaga sp. RHA_52]